MRRRKGEREEGNRRKRKEGRRGTEETAGHPCPTSPLFFHWTTFGNRPAPFLHPFLPSFLPSLHPFPSLHPSLPHIPFLPYIPPFLTSFPSLHPFLPHIPSFLTSLPSYFRICIASNGKDPSFLTSLPSYFRICTASNGKG